MSDEDILGLVARNIQKSKDACWPSVSRAVTFTLVWLGEVAWEPTVKRLIPYIMYSCIGSTRRLLKLEASMDMTQEGAWVCCPIEGKSRRLELLLAMSAIIGDALSAARNVRWRNAADRMALPNAEGTEAASVSFAETGRPSSWVRTGRSFPPLVRKLSILIIG